MEWIVFLVMFWNVENFFTDKPHFRDKCNGIAKTVMLAGDEFGALPDIIGLAEVDSRQAVQKLLSHTALRKLDYGIVHYDSPDRRGIDCALLYRRSSFRELPSRKRSDGPGSQNRTVTGLFSRPMNIFSATVRFGHRLIS